MMRITLAVLGALIVTQPAFSQTAEPPAAPAPAPAQRPMFETTKVDGTDNVYIFRAVNAQSMFIVTKAGVIATDPNQLLAA